MSEEIMKKTAESKDWQVHDALGRVRSKVFQKNKDKHIKEMYNAAEHERTEQRSRKKSEIDVAWVEHENAEKTAKAQADKLTAKQIKEFMQEQNG